MAFALIVIVLIVVLILFGTPWRWLLRALGILAAAVLQLIILESQFPCNDFGCGMLVAVAVVFGLFVSVICLLRFALIKWQPGFAMADVGKRWIWIGNFCLAAAASGVVGLWVFILMIWALAGGDSALVHWGLAGSIAALIALAVWSWQRWGVVQSGLVAGVAATLSIGLLQSLWFPDKVIAAAQKKARGTAYCIYFPRSDRFVREKSSLTLLTIEKSANAYQNRHAILVWEQKSTLRTAFWSFGQERFVQGYQHGVHPVPRAMETRFRACLARRLWL